MAIPAPVYYPPFNVVRLNHVELVVRDLTVSKAFYVDTMGLQITYEDSTHVYLRAMEERAHHCVILMKGDEPCVNVCGFKVYDDIRPHIAQPRQHGHAHRVLCENGLGRSHPPEV